MKKMMLALVATGLTVPAPALAQSDGEPGRFETMRECEKAVRMARNDERRLNTEPGRERGQLNKEEPAFVCVADPDGGFNAEPTS